MGRERGVEMVCWGGPGGVVEIIWWRVDENRAVREEGPGGRVIGRINRGKVEKG